MIGVQIGELAAAVGVSTKALRVWETAGILIPLRSSSGYREYPADAVEVARFVRRAQDAGFTLVEIAGIVAIRAGGDAPCAHVGALIAGHLDEIETRLRELRALRADLRGLAERAERIDPGECPPEAVCQILNDR